MAWIETHNGIPLPCPQLGSSGISIASALEGGRNAENTFIGSVIGEDKLQYELSFSYLSPEEFKSLLNLFDRKKGGRLTQLFRIFDPRENEFRLAEMYIGDRGGRPLGLDEANGYKPTGWCDIKITLIEV